MFCTGRTSEELGRSTEGLVEFGFQSVESWVSFLELRSFAVDRIKGGEDRDRDFFLFRHVLSCRLSIESDLTVVTKCVPSLASLLLNISTDLLFNGLRSVKEDRFNRISLNLKYLWISTYLYLSITLDNYSLVLFSQLWLLNYTNKYR